MTLIQIRYDMLKKYFNFRIQLERNNYRIMYSYATWGDVCFELEYMVIVQEGCSDVNACVQDVNACVQTKHGYIYVSNIAAVLIRKHENITFFKYFKNRF